MLLMSMTDQNSKILNRIILTNSEFSYFCVGWPIWRSSCEWWSRWQWCQGKTTFQTAELLYLTLLQILPGCGCSVSLLVQCKHDKQLYVMWQYFLSGYYFPKFMRFTRWNETFNSQLQKCCKTFSSLCKTYRVFKVEVSISRKWT